MLRSAIHKNNLRTRHTRCHTRFLIHTLPPLPSHTTTPHSLPDSHIVDLHTTTYPYTSTHDTLTQQSVATLMKGKKKMHSLNTRHTSHLSAPPLQTPVWTKLGVSNSTQTTANTSKRRYNTLALYHGEERVQQRPCMLSQRGLRVVHSRFSPAVRFHRVGTVVLSPRCPRLRHPCHGFR